MANLQPWQLATPAQDGGALLWPDGGGWVELAEQTHRRLAAESTARLLDLPLAEARRSARQALAALAGPEADIDQPWFVTGHQTFPYHPGIWAKSAAVDAAAARAGGAAIYLNVDHDLPHAGPQVSWPAMQPDGQLIRRGDLELDHLQPFERQPAPGPRQVQDVCRQVAGDLDPLLTEKRTCPFQLSADPPTPDGRQDDPRATHFGQWFARVRARLDATLGLRLVEAMTSRLAEQDSFVLFVADAIARADSLHPAYNQAVRDCEQVTGRPPAPSLQTRPDQVELPFWTLRPNAPGRHRLFVSVASPRVLSDGRGPIGQIESADLRSAERAVDRLRRLLGEHDVHLRPRALTLTLFARLLLADLFVHGIGGGSYDYAADCLCQRHYGLAAPPLAIATATLRLPLDVATASAEQLRQARCGLRDMRFNPQRHLPPDVLARPPVRQAVDEKWASIELNRQLRQADRDPGRSTHRRRHELFLRVRNLNEQLADLLADRVAQQSDLVAQLSRRQQAGQVASARDFFYGLFPAARLNRLRETITEMSNAECQMPNGNRQA